MSGIDYRGFAHAKPEPRARTKRRKSRLQADADAEIRVYVFGRERGICRCCRWREAESRHELTSRGAGGKVTKRNCVAVCGTIVGAVPSCHTYLQSYAIRVEQGELGAEGPLTFTPQTQEAAEWMRVKVGEAVLSEPMAVYEAEL